MPLARVPGTGFWGTVTMTMGVASALLAQTRGDVQAAHLALQQGVDHEHVGMALRDDRSSTLRPSADHVEQLDVRWALSRLRTYCATCGTSSTRRRRIWSDEPDTTADYTKRARRTARSAPGPNGRRRDRPRSPRREAGRLGQRDQLVGRHQSHVVCARDTAHGTPAGRPGVEPGEHLDIDRSPGRCRRCVDLGHQRPVSGSVALPFEIEPAVVEREIRLVGQPDVDDEQAARPEVPGRPRQPAACRSRVSSSTRLLRAMKTSANRAPRSIVQEVAPARTRGCRWRLALSMVRAQATRARASIAGSRSTAVTTWPATASGTARRPVPAVSSSTRPSSASGQRQVALDVGGPPSRSRS